MVNPIKISIPGGYVAVLRNCLHQKILGLPGEIADSSQGQKIGVTERRGKSRESEGPEKGRKKISQAQKWHQLPDLHIYEGKDNGSQEGKEVWTSPSQPRTGNWWHVQPNTLTYRLNIVASLGKRSPLCEWTTRTLLPVNISNQSWELYSPHPKPSYPQGGCVPVLHPHVYLVIPSITYLVVNP